MTRLFQILFWVFVGISCNNGVDKTQEIKYYHRNRLDDGGHDSYSGYLAISNYESKPATAKQLLQLSNSYLDTARAKLPIESITFTAKDIERPELIWNSEIFRRESINFLITFDYENTNFDTVNKAKRLLSVTIWKHAEPLMYYQDHLFSRAKKMGGRNLIDSILNSTEPINPY